ncbi:type II toxin-antitoxin system HicA family toxin [Myxosarcina sp. GI1]|uniref:type II toxin-antitoxin system HicA family toxin n=1 Tax=Myxosarcina sp. GI1 TaxID=1541065 RepID=UPI000559C49B|nr:type II toxin-antitoxin system HicA family toxin [Myxosarcina sp. GI1]
MKIRTLKSKLSKAGFVYCSRRGKGSHNFWKHPIYPILIVQSGKDNSDAKPYQIKAVDSALQQIDCRRQSAISEKCRINVVDCS